MRYIHRPVGAAVALALAGLASGLAQAAVFVGDKGANQVVGSSRADRMRLGGGNDRASGHAGADRIAARIV